MTSKIPDKLYFKIGEVSKLADVAPHVLRYWESEFSTIKPKRAGSKQRLYRRKDVELILTIKNLLQNKKQKKREWKNHLQNDKLHKEKDAFGFIQQELSGLLHTSRIGPIDD